LLITQLNMQEQVQTLSHCLGQVNGRIPTQVSLAVPIVVLKTLNFIAVLLGIWRALSIINRLVTGVVL
jgi:hypothetical protein